MSGLAKWLGGVAVNPTLATYETEKMGATVGQRDDTKTWPQSKPVSSKEFRTFP